MDLHASTLDMTQPAVLFSLGRLAAVVALGSTIVAAECLSAELPALLSGARLEQQLEQPVTVAWSNLSFREAMASFSETQQVAVQIDRRIDADALFALTVTGDPLRTAILKIAQRKGATSSLLGSVVYFGPKSEGESLQTLAALRRDDLRQLPASARRRMARSRATEWPDLAEPRKLIAELAGEAQVKVLGLEQVPHDLWAANRWPSMPWCDRMTLLLVQFGLTFDVAADGRSVRLVEIPAVVSIARSYAGGGQPEARARKVRSLVPAAKVSVAGDKIEVVGRMEDQEEISRLLSGRTVRTTVVKPGEDVYKLNVEGLPLKKVFAQLAGMLKLNVKYEQPAIDAAGVSLDQLISFKVENASLDDLLTAALENTGLTFERKENVVTIRPQ